jgi:hypothetical protein
MGRAFRVTRTVDAVELCLKVVHSERNANFLHSEFTFITSLDPRCAEFVVGAVEGSYVRSYVLEEKRLGSLKEEKLCIAGVLMPTVGAPFSRMQDLSADDVSGILESPSGLHACSLVRGDARLRNVGECSQYGTTSYRWIDFSERMPFSVQGARTDILDFLRSCGRYCNDDHVLAYANNVQSFPDDAARKRAVCSLVL